MEIDKYQALSELTISAISRSRHYVSPSSEEIGIIYSVRPGLVYRYIFTEDLFGLNFFIRNINLDLLVILHLSTRDNINVFDVNTDLANSLAKSLGLKDPESFIKMTETLYET